MGLHCSETGVTPRFPFLHPAQPSLSLSPVSHFLHLLPSPLTLGCPFTPASDLSVLCRGLSLSSHLLSKLSGSDCSSFLFGSLCPSPGGLSRELEQLFWARLLCKALYLPHCLGQSSPNSMRQAFSLSPLNR